MGSSIPMFSVNGIALASWQLASTVFFTKDWIGKHRSGLLPRLVLLARHDLSASILFTTSKSHPLTWMIKENFFKSRTKNLRNLHETHNQLGLHWIKQMAVDLFREGTYLSHRKPQRRETVNEQDDCRDNFHHYSELDMPYEIDGQVNLRFFHPSTLERRLAFENHFYRNVCPFEIHWFPEHWACQELSGYVEKRTNAWWSLSKMSNSPNKANSIVCNVWFIVCSSHRITRNHAETFRERLKIRIRLLYTRIASSSNIVNS